MKAGIFTTRIEKVIDLGVQETRHFKLVFEPGTEFDFEAGQFVNAMAPAPLDRPTTAAGLTGPAPPPPPKAGPPLAEETKIIKRPYSIASPPYLKGYIDLVWKRIEGGFMTNYFWRLKEGDTLQIQGPLGRFGFKKPPPARLVFVATGTGIAPFRSMIQQMFKEGTDRDVWLIFGNRYETDILYDEDWKHLAAQHKNFHYVPTVSRPKHWTGERDYVQKLLSKCTPSTQDTHVYICGLTNMINEVQKTALEMGFAKEQILFEKYD